jgi:methylated-DNA-[protein]-cysteine S-methyltransferase
LRASRSSFSSIAVDLDGIDGFRQRLYAALRGVGFGRTTTYGELARELDLVGWEGARDVGEAMGKNPMPIVIPCHRVLAAGNKIGGFSAYGGTTTKQKLLALEGVDLNPGPPRLPGL